MATSKAHYSLLIAHVPCVTTCATTLFPLSTLRELNPSNFYHKGNGCSRLTVKSDLSTQLPLRKISVSKLQISPAK